MWWIGSAVVLTPKTTEWADELPKLVVDRSILGQEIKTEIKGIEYDMIWYQIKNKSLSNTQSISRFKDFLFRRSLLKLSVL